MHRRRADSTGPGNLGVVQSYATEPLETTLRRGTPLVWAHGHGAELTAALGWGEALRFEAYGADRMSQLAQAFRAFTDAHGTGPQTVAFVTATFSPESARPSVLIVPHVRGSWHDGALHLAPNAVVSRGASERGAAGGEGTRGPLSVPDPSPAPTEPPEELEFLAGDLTRQNFRRAVERAVELIDAGEADKIVLARDLRAVGTAPIDVAGLIERLQASNPHSWTFQVDGMIGASPEMLVSRSNGRVYSRVLAGSAPVTGHREDDAAAATALRASGKDHIEHEYAVRSVSSRLAPIAKVHVEQPYVLKLRTIMHLATTITGTLAPEHAGLSALEIAEAVHPSAAVCGTPTERAAELIAGLEGYDRGRYSGPVGWVNAAGAGEFAIALRCGQLAPDERSIRLYAGGGIVTGSQPTAELAETAQKFLPMYQALSPVAQP